MNFFIVLKKLSVFKNWKFYFFERDLGGLLTFFCVVITFIFLLYCKLSLLVIIATI